MMLFVVHILGFKFFLVAKLGFSCDKTKLFTDFFQKGDFKWAVAIILLVYVICVGHGADDLFDLGAERGGGDDFDIGSEGENLGDELSVDLHVDGYRGEVGLLADDALREVQGLGFDVVETVVAHAQHNIQRLQALGYRDADDIVEVFLEVHLGFLVGHIDLLETLDAV